MQPAVLFVQVSISIEQKQFNCRACTLHQTKQRSPSCHIITKWLNHLSLWIKMCLISTSFSNRFTILIYNRNGLHMCNMFWLRCVAQSTIKWTYMLLVVLYVHLFLTVTCHCLTGLEKLVNLVSLNLEGNQVETIPGWLPKKLKALRNLRLASNNVISVSYVILQVI